MAMIFEVDHRWVEELFFTYSFPVTRYVAGELTFSVEYGFVVGVHLDVLLIDSVLKVASLIGSPLFLVPMFVIRPF